MKERLGKERGNKSRAKCKDDPHTAGKPFPKKIYKHKTYASRCEYKKEAGQCKGWVGSQRCSKTCNGKGDDNKSWNTKPYKVDITVEKSYPGGKCQYLKEQGHCEPS